MRLCRGLILAKSRAHWQTPAGQLDVNDPSLSGLKITAACHVMPLANVHETAAKTQPNPRMHKKACSSPLGRLYAPAVLRDQEKCSALSLSLSLSLVETGWTGKIAQS